MRQRVRLGAAFSGTCPAHSDRTGVDGGLECVAGSRGERGPGDVSGSDRHDLRHGRGGPARRNARSFAGDGPDLVCGGPNPPSFTRRCLGAYGGEVLFGDSGDDTLPGGPGAACSEPPGPIAWSAGLGLTSVRRGRQRCLGRRIT